MINLRCKSAHFAAALSITALTLSAAPPAMASHPEETISTSIFEMDTDANLIVDDAGNLDWAAKAEGTSGDTERRRADLATGANDDSYRGGVKEDTECPGETTGSIPNNKSDLLNFGLYHEKDHPGVLNIFWQRVTDPSGTTLMDFELNQSSTNCPVGPNKVRTDGDLLIEYSIVQGGAKATILVREWDGTAHAWGAAQDFTALQLPPPGVGPRAAGTINSSDILAADSDGLITEGSISPRTFGEAQLDLSSIVDPDQCLVFSSAMIKSRSSDAFSSQLKDFIRPVPLSISTCASVTIRKVTDPTGSTENFGFTHSMNLEGGVNGGTFNLGDGDDTTFTTVLQGNGYTVEEDTLPIGWDLDHVDCSASNLGDDGSGGILLPTISGATITFSLDDAADTVDCTYYNKARGTLIVEKITDDGAGSFDFTSTTLTPAAFTLTTTAAGTDGKDSQTFSNLLPGTYDVAETVPDMWNLVSGTCSDGSDPGSISIAAGETVTCTFHNTRERGAIKITKTRKHAASGSGDHPHAGVTFTLSGNGLAEPIVVQTDGNGEVCVPNLLLSGFAGVGNYTVTETVPAGYQAADSIAKEVTVASEGTCTSGFASVAFSNIPLTNLTVSVDSQVDGGTASTIDCVVASGATGANGDGSVTVNDLVPGTYTCTIVIDP